jgi:hypothetical protein
VDLHLQGGRRAALDQTAESGCLHIVKIVLVLLRFGFCEILSGDWGRFTPGFARLAGRSARPTHNSRCEAFAMACNPEVLKHVPLFALLDEEETAVLAGQVRLKTFTPRQRIYKMGDASGQAYVVVSGRARITTVDQDHQEVVVDEPTHGEFFGFASMLEQTPHQTI